jgi:hypothetical protein
MSDMPTTAPMPADLPPLSDEAAVEILEFLHELVFRFEAQYFGQIRRFYHQQIDLFEQALPPTHGDSPFDDDVPF